MPNLITIMVLAPKWQFNQYIIVCFDLHSFDLHSIRIASSVFSIRLFYLNRNEYPVLWIFILKIKFASNSKAYNASTKINFATLFLRVIQNMQCLLWQFLFPLTFIRAMFLFKFFKNISYYLPSYLWLLNPDIKS